MADVCQGLFTQFQSLKANICQYYWSTLLLLLSYLIPYGIYIQRTYCYILSILQFSVFIVNIEHISHFGLMFLLLILCMSGITGFDLSYFSRFQNKRNSSFIVYSFLEKISSKWNAHSLASSSKQDMFITNFNANCNANFLYLFCLLINKMNL